MSPKSDHGIVDGVVAVDDGQFRRMSLSDPHAAEVARGAAKATEVEQQMTLLQGIRKYPKAVAWSAFLSTTLIMEGYDKIIINNLYAFPPFKKNFGVQGADGSYQVEPAWQSALSNASLICEVLGLMITGLAAVRYGYRRVMIGALGLLTALIFITFFAENIETLLAGQILMGVPLGGKLRARHCHDQLLTTWASFPNHHHNLCIGSLPRPT